MPGDGVGRNFLNFLLLKYGDLQAVARDGGNIFQELLKTARTCFLGQISIALY